MGSILDYFPDLGIAFQAFWFVFSHGGWVIFVLLTVYILFKMYEDEIQTQYKSTIEWTTYEVRIPRENLTSLFSVEQIFTQLHILLDNFSLAEKYIEGKVQFWMSFEIVSLGGKISFIIRAPKKLNDLVQSAFYAQYPKAELREVTDYLSKFDYNPDNKDYDLFATEFTLTDDESVPLRTYRDFEEFKSADKEEKVIDPLGPLFEAISRANPGECYAYQIIIRAANDGSWKPKAEAMIKKLQGEAKYSDLSDITKERITWIQRKLGKPGFEVKMRFLQIGLTSDFNKDIRKLLLSPIKLFGLINGNRIRPIWGPKLDYKISKTLEAPYIDAFVRNRKILLFKAFKGRSLGIGTKPFILCTEELATLWHLPVSTDVPMPLLETMDSKKIQPPANLPIG
jgi:hypothetical protein